MTSTPLSPLSPPASAAVFCINYPKAITAALLTTLPRESDCSEQLGLSSLFSISMLLILTPYTSHHSQGGTRWKPKWNTESFIPPSAMVAMPDGLMGSLLKWSCFLFLILPCSHWFRLIKCYSQWELAIILSRDVISEKLNFTFF